MSSMQYTPESEIQHRIAAVQARLAQSEFDGLLVVHHTHLFYYSGTSQNAYLFIPEKGVPLLMVRKSYERAVNESRIKDIVRLGSLRDVSGLIKAHLGCECPNIGLELDVIPYNTFEFYQNTMLPDSSLGDASRILKEIRLIKSDYEISLLRHSCSVLDHAFSMVSGILCEGMSEIELAARFEADMRENGLGGGTKVRAFNRDFMFGNIVSGVNGKEPSYFDGPVNGPGLTPANNPHGAGWKKIGRDEAVYIDYACVVNGYTADAERIFVIGTLDEELVRAHQVALTIQAEMIDMIRPGVRCSRLWGRALEIAEQEGLLSHFMGMAADKVKFLGHGVGLELDEMPIFAKGFDISLEKGMTFALEPKFVFPRGAIGIENTFALTEKGVEKLNKFSEDIHYI